MKTKKTIIGMLLLVVAMSFAQKSTEKVSQPYHQFSLDAGYLFSSLKENDNPNRPLFAGDGVNIGVGHRWGDLLGIASRIGFATGNVDQAGMQSITNGWDKPPIYDLGPKKANWSQISIMTGPSIKLGKKRQFELNAMGGVGFNPSPNTITADAYEQEIFLERVYTQKEKSVVGMWQVNASYKLALLSKKGNWLRILGGYGSNGATIGLGVGISERDCSNVPCCRCEGWMCLSCDPPPKSTK